MPRASLPNVFNMEAHLNHLSPSACKACCLAQVSFALRTTELGEISSSWTGVLQPLLGLNPALQSGLGAPSPPLLLVSIKHVYVGSRVKRYRTSS